MARFNRFGIMGIPTVTPPAAMSAQAYPGVTVSNAQKLEEDYVDIPPPPPPPVGVGANAGSASDWANPYVSSPPMVSVADTNDSSFPWGKLFDTARTAATGLVNIFGQPVTPQGQPVYTPPPPSPGLPLAAWVAIGVGGVLVLGVAARSLAARSSGGGRRRRYAGRNRR